MGTILILIAKMSAAESASIIDFKFVADQQFNVKEWGYLIGNDDIVTYEIPENSTVTVGPNEMTWNMCGSQKIRYNTAENTYFDFDNLETTPCNDETKEGSVAMEGVLKKGNSKNQAI